MKKYERMDNLYYKGKRTGYRYFGTLECCYTMSEFNPKPNSEEEYGSIDNILRKEDYEDVTKPCKDCKYSSNCEKKNNVFDETLSCKLGNFENIVKDITQKIVFYNEQLNSAVMFSVEGDFVCDNYGFETVEDLLDDIYDGVNSPYADDSIDYFEEIGEGLELRDNLMYIRYINAECQVDNDVIKTYCSLKGKKIYGMMDIISIFNMDEDE